MVFTYSWSCFLACFPEDTRGNLQKPCYCKCSSFQKSMIRELSTCYFSYRLSLRQDDEATTQEPKCINSRLRGWHILDSWSPSCGVALQTPSPNAISWAVEHYRGQFHESMIWFCCSYLGCQLANTEKSSSCRELPLWAQNSIHF